MKLKHIICSFLGLAALLHSSSCTKEYVNPNAATKTEVLSSADGLMGLAVGIRREWSVGATSALFNVVVCNGLATKELTVLNTGNNTLASLEAGKGSLNGANSTMANLWTSANLVKAYAQQLIDNSSVIGDPGTKAGVEAYGLFFKALAIGTLSQFWEQVPTEVVSSNEYIDGKRPGFKPRAAALDEAIAILKQADATIKANAPSATFNAKVGTDISLPNAIQAMIARFSLMNGKLDDALRCSQCRQPIGAFGVQIRCSESESSVPFRFCEQQRGGRGSQFWPHRHSGARSSRCADSILPGWNHFEQSNWLFQK